jgi:hypothetical protein
MRIFKIVFDFYINSSIHVALAVYALTWITLNSFEISYDENILYFNFYATITGYNFVKYFGLAKFHHRSLANWLKIIQVFSFICFIILCVYAFNLKPRTLFWIAGFGLVTFFYAIPLLPKTIFLDEQHNLRSVSGLKIYIIALVWSGVTVLLPLLNNNFDLNTDVFITTGQRFLLIIALILPFEIRDMNFDSIKLSTIPQSIGIKTTKRIGVILLVVFYVLEYLKDEVDIKHSIILLVITILTILLILFSRKNQQKYYSAFWVEAVPVFWMLLLILFG